MPDIDIIIPTCKSEAEVSGLEDQVLLTAGAACRVFATCQKACAAKNRNIGLDWATGDYRIMIDDDISGFPHNWARDLVRVLEMFSQCEMVSASLLKPDGTPGVMMGHPGPRRGGIRVIEGPHLLSACIAFRANSIRYDEAFIGSGWEDTDYCMQLRQEKPGCTFMVHEGVKVVHRNEMKSQSEHFQANRQHYISKWGRP